MPKVVFSKVLYVNSKFYSTLRSFLESSLKDEYPWNTGIILPMTHNALFVKKGKWVLNIDHRSSVLFTYDWKQVISVMPGAIYLSTTESEYCEVEDTATTFVLPKDPLPFAIPINLGDIVSKIQEYKKALREVIPPDVSCYGKCW